VRRRVLLRAIRAGQPQVGRSRACVYAGRNEQVVGSTLYAVALTRSATSTGGGQRTDPSPSHQKVNGPAKQQGARDDTRRRSTPAPTCENAMDGGRPSGRSALGTKRPQVQILSPRQPHVPGRGPSSEGPSSSPGTGPGWRMARMTWKWRRGGGSLVKKCRRGRAGAFSGACAPTPIQPWGTEGRQAWTSRPGGVVVQLSGRGRCQRRPVSSMDLAAYLAR
jgi:hypothetical protein